MINYLDLPVIEKSITTQGDTTYMLTTTAVPGERLLAIVGPAEDFVGERQDAFLLCPLSAENAYTLRQRLPWLQPVPLGLQTSAGFGDRLGIATPGHAAAVSGTGVAPIFAQQSVRENTRTGRTPQQVLDDAMWGAFEAGWHDPQGADADHLKTLEDIEPFIRAGYSFFTVDPGAFVDDSAETATSTILHEKMTTLPWQTLHTSWSEMQQLYLRPFDLDAFSLTFDEHTLLKALVKYGAAVAHMAQMTERVAQLCGQRPFEMEISVDETGSTTSLLEHWYIASELKRLQVPFVSLAPRFVGRFEKGVGYIGDLDELDDNIAGHACIMRAFDNSYKLSLHTGSDKFTVYPLAMHHTGGRVHLKTAGTSYLEALRLLTAIDPAFFREILDFARDHYETDRQSYHVSASLAQVPESAELNDKQLPDLLDQFAPRQVLHVTFGSVLDTFGARLQSLLHIHHVAYQAYIQKHFERHLAAFQQKENE